MSLTFICKNCDKPFQRRASNAGEFCCHTCALEWRWNHAPEAEQRKKEAAQRMEATSLKPDKETLYHLHIEQKLSANEIGAIYNVQSQTVRKWVHGYNIPFTSRPIKVAPPNKKEIPPAIELRSLYEEQRLTTAEIAQRFGVASTTVSKWLRVYKIETRVPGTGLAARGVVAPTPEELYRMIHVEHLSYEQVAAKYGVDLTAVPYWLDKHGIPRPTNWYESHSEPSIVSDMQQAYESGLSLDEVSRMFGANSREMLKKIFREQGVPIRKDGWNGGKRFDCLDGHKVRSTYEQRVDNWLHEHRVDHTYEPSLPFSPTHKADFLANGWYIEVWGVNNNAEYKERKQRKIELYQTHHAHLIEVPYHAFAKTFNDLWIRRLEQCLIAASPEDFVQHRLEFR